MTQLKKNALVQGLLVYLEFLTRTNHWFLAHTGRRRDVYTHNILLLSSGTVNHSWLVFLCVFI